MHLSLMFAFVQARRESAACLSSDHLLAGLVNTDPALFDRVVPTPQWERLRRRFAGLSLISLLADPKLDRGDLPTCAELSEILAMATNQAELFGERRIAGRHILLSILQQEGDPAAAILKELGVDTVKTAERIRASGFALRWCNI